MAVALLAAATPILAGHVVESAEFAARARAVWDIGVRTAVAQSPFVTALTLVSAPALGLVYGLGGFSAPPGRLEPGAQAAATRSTNSGGYIQANSPGPTVPTRARTPEPPPWGHLPGTHTRGPRQRHWR
ncbi:hypothetical protein [Streptomyces huiliensis]|uniref:hypothetical protein n=1 Tax=Streptomyces huiliensis TaxID=2876027 RepID=UPI001CC164A7|nr:hypothetical protein [Streptomyces huiliensis]MBZ4321195.1 hypothetical protein [Streptomyces huiliensis]